METKYLKINPADNVVVAISDLKAGEAITVDGHAITLKEDVPAGHKVTLKDFAQGENIIKYGYPIGHAVTAVEQGRWINETQIKTNLAGLLDYTYNPVSVDLNIPKKDLTFKGYRRKNGDVGIRNEVWIIHRGLCKRYHRTTGRSVTPRNQLRRCGRYRGIPSQLWLFTAGR